MEGEPHEQTKIRDFDSYRWFFLSGCASWTRRQTVAATAAAVCGFIGAGIAGGVNHNNWGHELMRGKRFPLVQSQALCFAAD